MRGEAGLMQGRSGESAGTHNARGWRRNSSWLGQGGKQNMNDILGSKITKFVCLECDTYEKAQPGIRSPRCPNGHLLRPLTSDSFSKRIIKFAVLAAGVPLFGIIAFSKMVVFSPFLGRSIIAVFTIIMPLTFVVAGIVCLARWSKRRQAKGTPSAEYAREQKAHAIGLLGGTAFMALCVFLPIVLKAS
jgi:hypothetical protein